MRKGRLQTLDEAMELDDLTKELLDCNKVGYETIIGEKASIDIIVKDIVDRVGNKS